MKRREFIALVSGAAAWPVAAGAQQKVPVIGFLHPGSPEGSANVVAGFRKGLNETGFFEGRNVELDFRWALNDASQLDQLAAALVSRGVSAIATPGSGSPREQQKARPQQFLSYSVWAPTRCKWV